MAEDKLYKCIKGFELSKYDEHECLIENEYFSAPKDSVWVLKEHASMADIRLESDLGWLEIAFEDLKEYFVRI